MNRVVVTGIGMVSPLASNVNDHGISYYNLSLVLIELPPLILTI